MSCLILNVDDTGSVKLSTTLIVLFNQSDTIDDRVLKYKFLMDPSFPNSLRDQMFVFDLWIFMYDKQRF